MFQMISRIRLLDKTTTRKVLANRFCKKSLNSQARVVLNKNFQGYAGQRDIKFFNNRHYKEFRRTSRSFSSQINSTDSSERELDAVQFDKISEQTLDSLTEYFDELMEQAEHLQDADVSYGDGVLTIKLGEDHGTYVINRQTPNKQIWLSSPISGPKRYDFINSRWIYKHDGKTLHQLLDDEIPTVVKSRTSFSECSYGGGKDPIKSSQ